MSNESPKPEPAVFMPPVSAFSGPIAELVGHRLLSPPTRPGLLATLARYEIIRVLGSGGMGVVLLAHDGETGTDVAIKMIRPELVGNQQIVHRFVKEAGHLQKLKHPHIVPVLELADRDEGAYFVMPYFQRGSVANRIKPGQPMPNEAVLEIAGQIAEALQFAHRRGIIHRDLKPANILLDASGRACLADFGLARTFFNDTIVDVEHEQFEGTAPYMSPGIAAGNAEDTRCDIYAFGALLYEMLTGEPPFAGRTTNEIRKQILAGPPTPLLERNPHADADLAMVAEGAMSRELRDRYADMTDVVADIDRIKAGRHPEGPHGLTRRVRHTPPALWIPAVLLLLGLLVWQLWPSDRMNTASTPNSGVISNTPVVATPRRPLTIPLSNAPQPQPRIVIVPTPAPPLVTSPRNSAIIAGAVKEAGSADGPGPQARFSSPMGIAIDHSGNIYIADTGNRTIRKIAPDGNVTTLAGSPGKSGLSDGVGANARFMAPMGIAADADGTVYVSDFPANTIRKITPDGVVSTLAGLAGMAGDQDGSGDNAQFRNPLAVAVDARENVYVADESNWRIRKISPAGMVTTLPQHFADPHGVAVDGAGNIYVADTATNALWKITPSGKATVLSRFLSNPEAVAVDASGTVYVTDITGVHKISPNGATLLLRGLPFARASAIAIAPDGTICIADDVNDIICRLPKQ